jgi:hypothetical protein
MYHMSEIGEWTHTTYLQQQTGGYCSNDHSHTFVYIIHESLYPGHRQLAVSFSKSIKIRRACHAAVRALAASLVLENPFLVC